MAALPVDEEAAQLWVLLRVHLAETGRRVRINDLSIAAIAASKHLPVVTQDDDFDVLEGVAELSKSASRAGHLGLQSISTCTAPSFVIPQFRPYHLLGPSKLPFLGYERPWNAGYGSVSSARGWLTVIGRSAFRDDSTAN